MRPIDTQAVRPNVFIVCYTLARTPYPDNEDKMFYSKPSVKCRQWSKSNLPVHGIVTWKEVWTIADGPKLRGTLPEPVAIPACLHCPETTAVRIYNGLILLVHL